jgi:hypothetical protein
VGRLLRDFWAWYERNYALNVGITAALFALQLVHLSWLSLDVVAERITREGYFPLTGLARYLILIVDYTEIPALISTSVLYIYDLRKGRVARSLLFLLLLNSQWLHLFWITDEFVVGEFQDGSNTGSSLPAWLAWVAIGIDYLEIPVIVDTLRRFAGTLRSGRLVDGLAHQRER